MICRGAARGLFAALLLAGCGAYYAEVVEIRRLASALPGVKVLEVEGNHDVTLEDIWLEIEFHGEPIHFVTVTVRSFVDTAHLEVSRVGDWEFEIRGCEAGLPPAEERCHLWYGFVDFGREGDVGRDLEPPIRSIPEFLSRLPEIRGIIEQIPDAWPGARIGTREPRVVMTATGETRVTPLWLYALRVRTRE